MFEINIVHTLQTANGKLPMEISMSVPLGSTVAVTGPSGSGKTTLLRQLAGLANPQSGVIKFGNTTWLDTKFKINISTQKRNIGFVFQDYALFPHLSVYQNLAFGLEKGAQTDIIHELLHAIDLAQLADRKPHQLSGGQQQRVALARALVRKPDLLLLDEPLSALDHSMRVTLQDLLLKFHTEYGFTMIIVTHDPGEIFRLANQVVILENGKIVKQGAPAEVYLPDTDVSQDLVIYGKVLSCEKRANNLLVHALIGPDVKELNFPLHFADDLQPGQCFALKYKQDTAALALVNIN